MAVAYEELVGLELALDRKTGTAKRVVKIAWEDIAAFAEEIFPDPLLTGYLFGAYFTGFPWIVALKLRITPFVEAAARKDFDDWTQWYDFAQVEVEYGYPPDDHGQQSVGTPGGGAGGGGTPRDTSGPGGSDGATGGAGSQGGVTNTQEITFVTHKVQTGGEFITWPAPALQWSQESDRTTIVSPGQQPPPAPEAGAPARAPRQSIRTAASAAAAFDATNVVTYACQVPDRQNLRLEIHHGALVEIAEVVSVTTQRDGTILFNVTRNAEGTAAVAIDVGDLINVYSPAAAADEERNVGDNVNLATAVPIIEHTIEWNYVAVPPWLAMRQCMGKVNAYWFAGAAPETALFLGAECSREITSRAGTPVWKLSYKFSEKNLNFGTPNSPIGWNHFLRPTGLYAGTFQRINRRVATVSGRPPTTTGSINTTIPAVVTVASTGPPFPQQGQFVIQLGAEERCAVLSILSATQWAVLRSVQSTTLTPATGVDIRQFPGGVYDLADFRFLFVQ